MTKELLRVVGFPTGSREGFTSSVIFFSFESFMTLTHLQQPPDIGIRVLMENIPGLPAEAGPEGLFGQQQT